MIKQTVLVMLTFATISVIAQSQFPPGSTPAIPQQPAANTNQFGVAPTFANGAGQTFSVDQLASQLQNLRSAVEQTLPSLSAFNQNYSNSVSGGIGGTVSGLLSRALNRNERTNTAASGQSSLSFSNVVGALANLLNTNRNGVAALPQNTTRDLEALQNSLQPVVAILDRLNVSTLSTNQFASPYNTYPLSTNRLTPTGR